MSAIVPPAEAKSWTFHWLLLAYLSAVGVPQNPGPVTYLRVRS
jgi:hypothetical protein